MNTVVGRSSLVVGKTDGHGGSNPTSSVVRSMVALTACVTAVAGIPILSFLPAIISALSIAGAVLATRLPREAKHLIWFGAGATSLWVFPFGIEMLRISFTMGGTDPKVPLVAAVCIALVVVCDVALLLEGLSQRRTTNDQGRS